MHSTELDLEGTSYTGLISSYSGGGFYQDLGSTRANTEVIMANLKQNLWLDRGTRAVFIDFTVYNGNINLFCVVK